MNTTTTGSPLEGQQGDGEGASASSSAQGAPSVTGHGDARSGAADGSEKGGSSGAGYQISDSPRVDVSAATVARMMGIASISDLRVLEGRIDLLTSKVAAILTKMDRCLSMFGSLPSASDIGRVEVQLAAMKSMMRELMDSVGPAAGAAREQEDRERAQEQSRKLRESIKSNSES